MRKICKFIQIPCGLFDTPDLSVNAKWILLAIDSVCPNGGYVGIGVQGLSSLTNLLPKVVKEALAELYEHGAIEVSMQDGQKLMKPLLYKDGYPKAGEKIVVGDKPTDSAPLPYDEITEKWAEICTTLPKITRWSSQRRNKLRACLKSADASLDDLYKAFKLISTSCFLNGTKSDQWSCSFDWLIKSSSNLIKVLEGNYHKDYNEQRMYKDIMNGSDINTKNETSDDFYR